MNIYTPTYSMVDLLDEVSLPSIFDGSSMVPLAMGTISIKSSPVDQLHSVSTSCKSVAQSKFSTTSLESLAGSNKI